MSEYACNVCGAEPDEDGTREHGRGCYKVNDDGGGTDYVYEADRANAAQVAAERVAGRVDEIATLHVTIEQLRAALAEACEGWERAVYGSGGEPWMRRIAELRKLLGSSRT